MNTTTTLHDWEAELERIRQSRLQTTVDSGMSLRKTLGLALFAGIGLCIGMLAAVLVAVLEQIVMRM